MTERSGSKPSDRLIDESVFTPASERAAATKAAHESNQLDRPGSPTPPWQRGQQGGADGVPDGRSGAHSEGRSDGRGDGRSEGHGHPAVMTDQPTVAEQRPSYAPPVGGAASGTVDGSPNGSGSAPMSSVPNPFLSRAESSRQAPVQQGPPPHAPAQQHTGQQHPGQQHPGQQHAGQQHGGQQHGGQHGQQLGGQATQQHPGLGIPPRAQPGPGAFPGGGHGVGHGGPAPGAVRPTARPAAPLRARVSRAPRRASLQIRRFDPWSVLKLSLVLSVAMFLMWLVAVGVLYGVLDGMGVWDKLNGAYSDLASVNDTSGGGEPLISAGRVFGVSAVVGVVNIVLFTAFATVAAFVYNVSADLAGGIEVTLSERD